MKKKQIKKKISPENKEFFDSVARAMRRVPAAARKVARMYGTPLIVWENGKVVEKKP